MRFAICPVKKCDLLNLTIQSVDINARNILLLLHEGIKLQSGMGCITVLTNRLTIHGVVVCVSAKMLSSKKKKLA
jgi:hypothetical protein